jgi:hypothetical protein
MNINTDLKPFTYVKRVINIELTCMEVLEAGFAGSGSTKWQVAGFTHKLRK